MVSADIEQTLAIEVHARTQVPAHTIELYNTYIHLYHEKPFEHTEHTADPESMPQMKTLFNCQLLTNKQPLPVCKHKIIQMPVTQMFV